MKTWIAIIVASALLASALWAGAPLAFAETTANNSGRPLANVQAPPQGASGAGYFVGEGSVTDSKAAKAKAQPSHRR